MQTAFNMTKTKKPDSPCWTRNQLMAVMHTVPSTMGLVVLGTSGLVFCVPPFHGPCFRVGGLKLRSEYLTTQRWRLGSLAQAPCPLLYTNTQAIIVGVVYERSNGASPRGCR